MPPSPAISVLESYNSPCTFCPFPACAFSVHPTGAHPPAAAPDPSQSTPHRQRLQACHEKTKQFKTGKKKRDGCDWIVLYKSLIYDLRIKCLVYSKRWTAWMLYEIQLKFLNLHPLHWHFSQIKEKISSIHNKIPHFYNPYSSIILFKMITNKKKVHGLPLSK